MQMMKDNKHLDNQMQNSISRIEVAIQLGHSEKEVTRYYTEFWKLKRLYKLYQIYTQIEHCIPSFLKLNSALKKKGLAWQFGLEDFFR